MSTYRSRWRGAVTEGASDPRHRDVRQGLLSNVLTTLAQGLKWLLLSLLLSILLEWTGMVLWWPDEGLNHSRDMLAAEIGYLQADFGRSLVSSDPAGFTKTVADKTYAVLFEVTRLADFIAWVGAPARRARPASGPGCTGCFGPSPNTSWRPCR